MNLTEKRTHEYFKAKGYPLHKIPDGQVKTPDFENSEMLVEVKEISPSDENEGGDSTLNNLKRNLSDASRQFQSFDPAHNRWHIVVIFSRDIIPDDIFSVQTGKFSRSYPEKIYKGGMILSGKHRVTIDSVVWFWDTREKSPRHVATRRNPPHFISMFDRK